MLLPLHPRYSLGTGLSGSQSRSGQRGEEKNFHPTGTWTPDPSVVEPVASHYPGSKFKKAKLQILIRTGTTISNRLTILVHILKCKKCYLWRLNSDIPWHHSHCSTCIKSKERTVKLHRRIYIYTRNFNISGATRVPQLRSRNTDASRLHIGDSLVMT
jgi:hypothetical protein